MVSITGNDGLHGLDTQLRGIKVNVEAAGAVYCGTSIGQSFGHGHGFFQTGFTAQHGTDHLKTTVHAGVGHQLPVAAGGVIVAISGTFWSASCA